MSDETKDLAPCPWCGASPLHHENDDHTWSIQCGNPDCRVLARAIFYPREEVVEAWNSRAVTKDDMALVLATAEIGKLRARLAALEAVAEKADLLADDAASFRDERIRWAEYQHDQGDWDDFVAAVKAWRATRAGAQRAGGAG